MQNGGKALQPFCLSDGEIRDLYLFAKHKELNLYVDREDPQKTAERVRTLIGGTFSGLRQEPKIKIRKEDISTTYARFWRKYMNEKVKR